MEGEDTRQHHVPVRSKEFLKKLEGTEVQEGKIPKMEKFVEYLGRHLGKKRKNAKHALNGRSEKAA